MNALWKRVSGSASGTAAERRQVEPLVQMGFEAEAALAALRRAQGNADLAAEMLLQQQQQQQQQGEGRSAQGLQSGRDARAAAAEERRGQKSGPLSRLKGAMKGKSSTDAFETQLEAVCGQLAEFPSAVDTFIYAIGKVLENPGEKKFREVKTTNKRFKSTIGKAGALGPRLLRLLGFSEAGEWYVLRGGEDPARLWMAKAALERTQDSAVYLYAKDREDFEKAMEESMGSANEEENNRRKEYKNRVPAEPELGVAGTTVIRVFFSDKVVQRRFNSDDIVEGIIMWLGAEHSSVIPKKLRSGEWELTNATLFPEAVVDVNEVEQKTLQAANFWPSAELRIQPAGMLAKKLSEEIRDVNKEKSGQV